MTEPRVSIITPTFNRARFLGTAVKSVLNQTMPDWELVIVDDGSTDDTRQILQPFLQDPRIHYVYQSNSGQSAARNRALGISRAKFIGFLDSDDVWFDNKLEWQLGLFEKNPGADIVHGDETTIDEHGRETGRKNMRRYSGQISRQLLADNSVSITTSLVRRECFDQMGGFDIRYGVADDYELWLRLSTRYRFHYEPGLVAGYRVMPDQISSDKRKRFAANERIILDFLASHRDCLSSTDRRHGLAQFYARKARYLASVGDRRTALTAIRRVFALAPLTSTGWRGLYRILNPRRPQ